MTKLVKKLNSVRAVVLAAGLGKRMHSSQSKVLHHVLGKPIIWRVLKALNTIDNQIAQVEQIHLVVGHNAQEVEDYVRNSIKKNEFNIPVYFHKQEKQLGTGHALLSAKEGLDNFKGNLLVIPGDCPLIDGNTLGSLLTDHEKRDSDLTILSTVIDSPAGYGRIVKAKNGSVSKIVEEKDASAKQREIKEINSGVYCFAWTQAHKHLKNLKNDNKQGEYYLPDLIASAVSAGEKVRCFPIEDWRVVMGVNSRVELQQANKFLNEMVINRLLENGITVIDPQSTWISPEVKIEKDSVILPGCWLIGDIDISARCSIGPHTYMEGLISLGSDTRVVQSHMQDCIIGNECYIGPFAHLRGSTVIGDKVRIGNFVEIKNSKIGDLSAIGHLSYIGDTTIGQDTNIGAGTITANYDHITKIKANTLIGDGASIGSNSVLVAPVRIGDQAVTAAGTVVTKDVEDRALAVRRAKQENIAGWSEKRRQTSKTKA